MKKIQRSQANSRELLSYQIITSRKMLPDSLWILIIDNFGTFFEGIKTKTKKSGSILRKQWFVIKKVDLASLEFVHLPHPLSRDVFALIQFSKISREMAAVW